MDTRDYMFWLLCLPARLALATFLLIKDISPYNTIVCYTIAFVLFIKFLDQQCSNRPVYLGGFGGEVYWHNARLIHMSMYATAGTLMLYYTWGGAILYVDVPIAIVVHWRSFQHGV